MSFMQRASIVGTGLLAMAFTHSAKAIAIDFETYSTGSLFGQDNWESNSYNGFILGGLNGDVVVSTSAPPAGSRTLLYTQTGGRGATDVCKANVISITPNGTSAPELGGSVLLRADPNANGNGQVGLFLGPDAVNGTSPIGVLIEGSGAGVAYVIDNNWATQTGGNPFRPNGAYVSGHVLEFAFQVDFDSSSYQVAYRDVTAGEPSFTPLVGGNPDGSAAFFGSFPAEPNGTYSVDVGVFLRDGIGRVDNITLNAIPEPGTLGLAGLVVSAGVAWTRRRRFTCRA
jgi:hypothetical protein